MSSVAHIIRRRRNRKDRRQIQQSRSRLWYGLTTVVLLLLVIIPLGAALGLAGIVYFRAAATLTRTPDDVTLDPMEGTTELYDRTGSTLLFRVSDPLGDDRRTINIKTLSPYVIQATLQIEDPDFLTATQFDAGVTLTRLWNYIRGVLPNRDPSLTARLVRNTLLPEARRSELDDELLQFVLTAEVNRRYSPEKVLEWYLNTAYYGKDAYGIESAAQVYLGKSAAELTLDEAALLAAIPLAPKYNPFDNERDSRARQTNLLRDMLGNGLITQPEFDAAINRVTPLRKDPIQPPLVAPEFSFYAREQAEDILTDLGMDGARLISRGGLRITTTLDMDLYNQAECTLRAHMAQLRGQPPESVPALNGEVCKGAAYLAAVTASTTTLPDNGALLLMDVATGEIRAMTGDVIATEYQPGAMLNPFVYLQGFLSGEYTPATMLLDIPQTFPGPAEGLIYTPTSADGQFRGPVNLRDAFAAGLLPPVVYVADTQGLNRVLFAAHQIGLNSLDENTVDLSLLERGGAVSLLDMTYAYSVFAAQGTMIGIDVEPVARNYRSRNPVAVLKIEDAEGNVLWEYDDNRRALSRTSIVDADVAYLITDILSDKRDIRRAVLGVDTSVLGLNRPAAVNTTMAGDKAESWTVGYTPQFIMGVHLGRTDRAAMSLDAYGLQGAAPVWQALMRYAHDRDALPPTDPPRPDNIVQYTVCDKSGMTPPAGSQCPTRPEYFLRNLPPTQYDTYWQSVQVNSTTGQRATASTPASLVIENVYFVPPDAALDWWRSNRLPLPPTDYDILSRPEALQAVQILLPVAFSRVHGKVEILGSIDAPNMQFFQLSYGQGPNPTQWFNIGDPQTTYTPDASLGSWDTTGLDGMYTLQFAVTYQDSKRDTDIVQVTIDNIPPVISLQAGEPGQVFRFPADNAIPVLANVQDNLGVQRVEFYHNGILLGTDEDWPYGFEHQIERTGIEVFSAVAFDQVGNEADTEIQVEVIRSGG